MKTIVDTSIWIEYLKNHTAIVETVDHGLLSNDIYIVGPVVTELLQGAKTEQDFQNLNNNLDGIPLIEAALPDWKLAGQISFKLKKRGITVPVTACLIAAIAINNEAYLYTYDNHFKQIPDVKLRGIPGQ